MSTARVPAALPWVLLAVGAALCAFLYPSLPDSWAVHYDAAGRPDHWVQKSWGAAFFPFLIGAVAALLLESVARGIPVRPPFPLDDSWLARLQAWQEDSLRVVSCGMAALMCLLSWVLPQIHSPHLVLLAVACLLALAVFAPASMLQALLREMREEGVLPPGYVGLTYRNPEDPRIFVPRLTGGGITLNLAHWQAWACIVLALAPLLAFLGFQASRFLASQP